MFQRKQVDGVPRSRIEALRAVPFFEGLPDKVLARIDAHVTEIDVPAGHILTAQGAGSHEAFVVEGGVAEVSIDGEVVRTTDVGELVGELGLLQHGLRSATVVATTPMQLLVMNGQDLGWLFEDAEVAARIQANVDRHQAH